MKPSTPLFTAIEFTKIFVDVPSNVQLPPRIPAKDIGIKSFDEESFSLFLRLVIILIKTMTTAVVLIKADIAPEVSIKAGILR